MNITSAKWMNTMAGDTVLPNKENIWAVIDGKALQVPTDPGNRHYIEIQKQVAAGTLTIEDPD